MENEVKKEETKEKITKKPKKEKLIFTLGKRKIAVAHALARKGTGRIRINSTPLEALQPEITRIMISELLALAGDVAKTLDIDVSVRSGGVMGQAEASRQAIAKALATADKSLRQKFLKYDRSLLIADARRTEPHKPSRSKAGPRRHKQRSKR